MEGGKDILYFTVSILNNKLTKVLLKVDLCLHALHIYFYCLVNFHLINIEVILKCPSFPQGLL